MAYVYRPDKLISREKAGMAAALLLGDHRIHESDFVSGTDIVKGLHDSGLCIPRTDRL